MRNQIFLTVSAIISIAFAQDPLFLTPFITAGEIVQAKELALVKSIGGNIHRESYAGLITVDEDTKSHLWFWFFPAIKNPETAPVHLWLDGGPGVTVLFSLFTQHGPYFVDAQGKVNDREFTWANESSMLYLENPVGTGYSFTESEDGYSTTSQHAALNSYEFLLQFFKMFPEFVDKEFHIAGISYGGHFAPPLAKLIHERNSMSPEIKINLKALILFAPWSDPINQLPSVPEYFHNVGLIGDGAKAHFQNESEIISQLINENRHAEAKDKWSNLIVKPGSYFYNVSGFSSAYNVLQEKDDAGAYTFIQFLETPTVRNALHVGNLTFSVVSPGAQAALNDEFTTSVASSIEVILNSTDPKYNVYIVGAQLDLSVVHLGIENMISNFNWIGNRIGNNSASNYENAERKIWRANNSVAGYTKATHNLAYILVRNAGHFIIKDQESWCYELISRIVHHVPF